MANFTIANPAGLLATAPAVAGGNVTFQPAVPGALNQRWIFIGGLPGNGPIQNVGNNAFAVLAAGAVAPGLAVITGAAINWVTVPLGGGNFNILPAAGAAVGWGDGGAPANNVVLTAPPVVLAIA